MSHALFRNCMAYIGEKPWHGLGSKVPLGSSAAEFLRAAGLDWTVGLVPAPGAKPLPPTKTHPEGRWTRYIIQRPALDDETGPVALGMVGDRYVPLQNTEAFAFFDPLLRDGWAQLETAGALFDGEVVWVQVRLREDMPVQDRDVVQRFLLLRNRHDGEGSVSVRFTPVRVVCQNTLTFAERDQRAFASVRHSVGMSEKLRLVEADAIRKEVNAFAERTRKVFTRMTERALTADERADILDRLCGKWPKRLDPDRPTRREEVEVRLDVQPSEDPLAGKETAWALYNAITWVEDQRAKRGDEEAAVSRIWFGGGADNKAKAFDVLARLVGAEG